MSLALLRRLNGSRKGALHRFIERQGGRDPRIAWYPSAGEDFRPLMYLSAAYAAHDAVDAGEPAPPGLFLFSDYFPWSDSAFLDQRSIYLDDRTSIVVETIEELPRVDLPLHAEIVAFPDGSAATNRVLFLEVVVSSDVLGQLRAPVLYVFSENEAFCGEMLLPERAHISHVVHVRYGGGLGGGGHASGVWIKGVLKALGTEVLISDQHFHVQRGDERAFELYPALRGQEPELRPCRIVPGHAWSNHGDVVWDLVRR